MASLEALLREQRRKANITPFAPKAYEGDIGYQPTRAPAPAPAPQVSAKGRIASGKAAGLYRQTPQPVTQKNPQVLSLNEAVTDVELPDGTLTQAVAPSGAPFVVRAPGSRSRFLDPVTGNTLAPDVTSPTGLRDMTAQREEEMAQRKLERSRAETAKLYEKAVGEVNKAKEEEQKRVFRDQENQYRLEGRRYFNDRNTGEPVALQTDKEFAAEKSEKAKKLAQETAAKAIRQKMEALDIEADELTLEGKPLSDKERKELEDSTAQFADVIRARGFSTDDKGITDFGASSPEDAPIATQYRQERDKLRADTDKRLKLETIERRKLDLRKQALDPDGWKQEKLTQIQESTDADLDREIEENEKVLTELDETAKAELAPIEARDNELLTAVNTAKERLGNARTGSDRIIGQRAVNEAINRYNAWLTESAPARESIEETYKALNDRVEIINQGQKQRQDRAIKEREAVYQQLAASPFLKPYGDRLQTLDKEESDRQKALVAKYPDGIPPEAEQALAQDITAKRQQLAQEIGYAQQTKQANLRGLYEKYGSKTRSEDWRTENDPQLEGQLFNMMQDARKMGLTEQEVREGLETSAALDWSNPRRVDKMGKPDFSEDFRMLPNGAVTINPRHYLDEVEYAAAVAKSPASDQEKKDALAMRRDLAAPLAAAALSELMEDPQMGAWMNKNTKGTPLERMEQFNAALKKGGALAASYNAFRGGAGSLAASLLGGIAAATDAEWATQAGQYFNQHAQAYQMAAEAAGKGTGPLGRFLSKVSGAVPSVAPGIAVGLATGGAGLPTSAALFANALTAGFQSLGGTYLDAYEAYQDKGLSPTEAHAKALAPAIGSGLATSLITAAGGARGAEAVLSTVSRETLRAGVKAAIGRVLTNLSEEALEEATDQLTQGIIAHGTYAKDKDIGTVLNEALEAGMVGAVIGGGLSGAREVNMTPRTPTEAPQAIDTTAIDLPENQAAIQAAITSFEPTPELLPQAVQAAAETLDPIQAGQNAAAALTAVASGQSLDSLPAAQLEAIGYEKTDKGPQPKKGVQPLVYSQDGQLVIRDEAIDWLETENQPALRDQIGLTEQERIAQIQQSKEPQANEDAKPTPTGQDLAATNEYGGGSTPELGAVPAVPISQSQESIPAQPSNGRGADQQSGQRPSPDAVRGSEETSAALSPEEQSQDLADQQALADAQAQEQAAMAQPAIQPQPTPASVATPPTKAAPPSRRKAIGKGTGKQSSYAEFPSDTDAQAFAYSGNAKKLVTGRNLSDSQRKKLLESNKQALTDLARATGLTEQELRGILPEYTKAITAQARKTGEGEAFQAESLADFIKRTAPKPAAKAESAPAKPAKPASKPTKALPKRSKAAQEVAEALGVDDAGKPSKTGFTATHTEAGLDPKRLQAAAKAIVETIDLASRIKGVKIKLSSDPNDTAYFDTDGSIGINPQVMAVAIARKSADTNQAPKDLVVHELIHRAGASRLSMRDYAALWRSLTPEMQEASRREYMRAGGVEPSTDAKLNDSIAGAEFFAQLVEARLKGKLASQVWDNPTIAQQVRAMVDRFIKALRDLANATTDPDWKKIIEKQAAAVEQDLREALREAGVEQELLGGTKERMNAPSPDKQSPIAPGQEVAPPTESDDADMMRQSLDDLDALESLRSDPEAMKALADQIQRQPEGQRTPDPRNRALMGVTEESRALQQAALVAQTQNGLEVQHQADVFKRAKDAIVKDRAAVEQHLFDRIEEGGVFTSDDIAMAQQITELLQRESIINPQDKALYSKLLTLTNAWADNKTAAGRALSIMRDPQQGPLERMRQSIAVITAPPARIRRQVRAAWSPREKSAKIKELEDKLAKANNEATVKLFQAELDKAKALKDKQEIIDAYAEENRALQDTILKTMNLTQDDAMLNPEDRYGVQEAVLDNPTVKEKVAALPRSHQNAIRLAMLGYSDKAIATRAGVKPESVPAIVENFRQNILKPAMTQAVRGGEGFAGFLARGLDKIKSRLRAPFQGTLQEAVAEGKMTAANAAAIEAEVDRIINFALQPARFRNKAGAVQAKVVTLPNGQKVRMFLPFDPDDARGFYRYARELSTREASAFDKIYEYWINGILSGPQTQVANIAGNLGQIGWNYTFQRMAETALNMAYRDKQQATLGEYPHVLKAFYKSVGPAWEAAKLAYDTEADNTRSEYLNEPLAVDFKDTSVDKVGGQRAAIGGKVGRVVRAFFKTAILNAEATAFAYRDGREQGFKGAALDTYMTQRLQDRGSDVWQRAMNVADELLFQSDNWATRTAQAITGAGGWKQAAKSRQSKAEASGDKGAIAAANTEVAVANFVTGMMRFLFPFVKTPTNILRVGVRKAGGAAIPMLFYTANGLYQRAKNGKPFIESYSKAQQVQDLSESALAGAAWYLLAALAEGDEDDDKKSILIVGNRPYGAGSRGEKEEVMRKYGGTQVIIFRDAQGNETGRFAYGRYEPFATALGVIVDAMRELKQARNKPLDSTKAMELTGSIGAHLMAQAESKSFLQGLAGIARTIEEVREGRFNPGPATGKALVQGIVPNLIRQSMRNIDDYQRDYKSADAMHEAFPTGDFAEPATGPAGDPVKKGGSSATRLLFQMPNAPSAKTAESVFQQYNLRNPDARIDRAPLTSAQYFAYGPDGKTRVELATREDKRLFREQYEKTYARMAQAFVTRNPLIKTKTPPPKVVKDAKGINADALMETRTRFLTQKKLREAAQRANN
jgi:hypothetical protein